MKRKKERKKAISEIPVFFLLYPLFSLLILVDYRQCRSDLAYFPIETRMFWWVLQKNAVVEASRPWGTGAAHFTTACLDI